MARRLRSLREGAGADRNSPANVCADNTVEVEFDVVSELAEAMQLDADTMSGLLSRRERLAVGLVAIFG